MLSRYTTRKLGHLITSLILLCGLLPPFHLAGSTIVETYHTVDGTALAGLDYAPAVGSLTIPAGNTSATFSVTGLGDSIGEGREFFFVNLSNVVNSTFLDSQGIGYIWDAGMPLIYLPYTIQGY